MSDEKTQAIEPKPKYQRKKCEHNKYPYYCVFCNGGGCCEHQKIRSGCKICKGSSYCIHGKVKQYCDDCGAKGKCEHGHRRSRCVQCGTGGSLCEHKKLRSRCRDCGDGSELCSHSRRREHCAECHGSGTCVHGLRRRRCDDCNGADRCIHKRDKNWCVQCAVGRVCEHGRIRQQCVPCGGELTCPHRKRKSICNKCSPTYLCEHAKQKNQCIICYPKFACVHERLRTQCVLCNPKIACQHCKYINVSNSRWKPHCFRCHCVLHPDDPIPRRFRLKEHYVVDALRAHFQDTLTLRCDKSVEGGCTRYRPDILIDFGSHILIVEIDEFRHTNYVCEQKRMVDLYEDMGYRNTVFLRFNPDGYHLKGVRYPTPFPLLENGDMAVDEEEMGNRMHELIQTILFYKDNAPEEPITYYYLFYGDQPLDEDDGSDLDDDSNLDEEEHQ